MSAAKHLSGQECFACRMDKVISEGRLPGGYTKSKFDQNPELAGKPAVLYYFRVGDLYKIGITTNLGRRVSSMKCKSKHDVEVMQTLNCPLSIAFEVEQRVLDKYSEHRVYRTWSTELFSMDVLNETPLNTFVAHSHTST